MYSDPDSINRWGKIASSRRKLSQSMDSWAELQYRSFLHDGTIRDSPLSSCRIYDCTLGHCKICGNPNPRYKIASDVLAGKRNNFVSLIICKKCLPADPTSLVSPSCVPIDPRFLEARRGLIRKWTLYRMRWPYSLTTCYICARIIRSAFIVRSGTNTPICKECLIASYMRDFLSAELALWTQFSVPQDVRKYIIRLYAFLPDLRRG